MERAKANASRSKLRTDQVKTKNFVDWHYYYYYYSIVPNLIAFHVLNRLVVGTDQNAFVHIIFLKAVLLITVLASPAIQ